MPTQLQLPFFEFKETKEGEKTKRNQRSKINQILSLVGLSVSLTTMMAFSLKIFLFMGINRHTPRVYTLSAIDYILISVFIVFFGLYVVEEISDCIREDKTNKTVDDGWCCELHCMQW